MASYTGIAIDSSLTPSAALPPYIRLSVVSLAVPDANAAATGAADDTCTGAYLPLCNTAASCMVGMQVLQEVAAEEALMQLMDTRGHQM